MTCAIAAISPRKLFPEEGGAMTNKFLLSSFPRPWEENPGWGRLQEVYSFLSLRGAKRRGNLVFPSFLSFIPPFPLLSFPRKWKSIPSVIANFRRKRDNLILNFISSSLYTVYSILDTVFCIFPYLRLVKSKVCPPYNNYFTQKRRIFITYVVYLIYNTWNIYTSIILNKFNIVTCMKVTGETFSFI